IAAFSAYCLLPTAICPLLLRTAHPTPHVPSQKTGPWVCAPGDCRRANPRRPREMGRSGKANPPTNAAVFLTLAVWLPLSPSILRVTSCYFAHATWAEGSCMSSLPVCARIHRAALAALFSAFAAAPVCVAADGPATQPSVAPVPAE